VTFEFIAASTAEKPCLCRGHCLQ